MTEQEIAKLMNVPFKELAVFCQDPDREQAHRYYNQMFRDYREVSIKN